jgi:glutamate synthase domain-containing protein 2
MQLYATGIIPDFISIDGAEGGNGAAPLEFTDHLGYALDTPFVATQNP